LKNHDEQRGREIVPAVDENNIIPYEKWIVSFSDSRKKGIKLSY